MQQALAHSTHLTLNGFKNGQLCSSSSRTALVMANAVATAVILLFCSACSFMYASSVGKLLEGSSVTGCRVSKYHVNRVNSGTFPDKPPLTFCSVDATETFKNILL